MSGAPLVFAFETVGSFVALRNILLDYATEGDSFTYMSRFCLYTSLRKFLLNRPGHTIRRMFRLTFSGLGLHLVVSSGPSL